MQHSMGLFIDNDMTVGEWADTWIKTYKSGVGYNTRKMYEDTVRIYVTQTIGHIKLKDLKTAHLQKIINDNSSKARTLEIFKLTATQMLNQAVANDLIVKNQALGVKLPVSLAVSKKRALTEDETEKIKNLVLDAKAKCFIMTLLSLV